ncbi:hypothetical protein [Psychrobacter sp. DM4]|uniref:hypothetical protein n=1 Tax=Psychrobacter sp. DM4 TaxID=3440637 RepID=UPI003F50BAF5
MMNYQPFLNMHVLLSDAFLAVIPPLLQIFAVIIGTILVMRLLRWWLKHPV